MMITGFIYVLILSEKRRNQNWISSKATKFKAQNGRFTIRLEIPYEHSYILFKNWLKLNILMFSLSIFPSLKSSAGITFLIEAAKLCRAANSSAGKWEQPFLQNLTRPKDPDPCLWSLANYEGSFLRDYSGSKLLSQPFTQARKMWVPHWLAVPSQALHPPLPAEAAGPAEVTVYNCACTCAPAGLSHSLSWSFSRPSREAGCHPHL